MAPQKGGGSLQAILNHTQKPAPPLLLVQHDLSVTPWPVIRHLIQNRPQAYRVVVLGIRFTRKELLDHGDVTYLDWTDNIPGYTDEWKDPTDPLIDAINQDQPGPVVVLIDSIDTLASDLNTSSQTHSFLRKVLSAIGTRPQGSKLILPVSAKSPLFPQLIDVNLSSNLTYMTLHPPELVSYVSKTYLTPPPLSDVQPTPKFWSVFLPVAQRGEGERLVLLGQDGAKPSMTEGVAEVLVRSGRKGPERTLEAWKLQDDVVVACKCGDLALLQSMPAEKVAVVDTQPDITRTLQFNLSLTESQSAAKARVPLPYAHQGAPQAPAPESSAIHYDPDSADDLDDEDPDEDLDL